MFFDGEGEGEEELNILLDVGCVVIVVGGLGAADGDDSGLVVLGRGVVIVAGGVWRVVVVVVVVVGVVEDPGVVEAEVDADVAVLGEAGVVEVGAEADDLDSGGVGSPEGVEAGSGVAIGVGFGVVAGAAGAGVWGPEVPLHLELVGHVVVEVFGGFGDGGLDDGGGGVLTLGRAGVVDVEALVGGGFRERDGVGGGGRDALALGEAGGRAGAADDRELAHDGDERCGEAFEAEVWKPEAEVELIGHGPSLAGSGLEPMLSGSGASGTVGG